MSLRPRHLQLRQFVLQVLLLLGQFVDLQTLNLQLRQLKTPTGYHSHESSLIWITFRPVWIWYLVLELLVLDSQSVGLLLQSDGDLLLLLLQSLMELLFLPRQLPDAALQLLHLKMNTGGCECDGW